MASQKVELEPGETGRFSCIECDCEFDLTLEPKLTGKDEKARVTFEEQEVFCCPFCSGDVEKV